MKIENNIKLCEEKGYFKELEAIYSKIPNGICGGCTACCHESVNITTLEGLNIIRSYYASSEPESEILIKRLLKYYLYEWIKPLKCPFLSEENKCEIYEARPLPCRLFGHHDKLEYEKNYENIKKQNLRIAAQILKNEGLRMPSAVINRKIEYCDEFYSSQKLNSIHISQLYDELLNLEGRLYFLLEDDEIKMNQNLVGFFLEILYKNQINLLDEIKLDFLRVYDNVRKSK